MKVKEKTVEELREELLKLNIPMAKWREKMLMVSKLYKSLGYKVKDVKESSLIDEVYSYIATFLNNVLQPTTETFYTHVLIEREVNFADRITERLENTDIKEMILPKTPITKDHFKDDEEFLVGLYSTFGLKAVNILSKDARFMDRMMEYYKNKYSGTELRDFAKKIGYTNNGAIECVCEFINDDAVAKKALEAVLLKEFKEEERVRRVNIKRCLIERLTGITNFFEQVGYLDEVMESHNATMDKLKLPMKVSMGEDKENFNLLNLKDPKYYEQFTNEELFVFSAYYSNRLEKVVEKLYDGIYLHAKLDSFYRTVEFDEIPRKITSDDAKTVLRQKYFLESLSRNKFKDFKDSINDDTKASDLDFSYVPEEYIVEYKKAYEEYFNRFLKENNFEEEYRFLFSNRSLSYCMYAIKDFSMESFMYTLSIYKTKLNFGLIRERRKTINEYGEEQVLIGVDQKEMPQIRLHFPKKDFDEFVDRFFPDGDFPYYIGATDFLVNGFDVKPQIIFKFTKKQKQAIKKMMDDLRRTDPDSDMCRFIEHMYENIHPNKNPLNNKKKPNFDEI